MSEILKDKQEIIVWLEQHKIKNYTLVPDDKYSFLVDVEGDVVIFNKMLTYIPVKFGNVSGHFSCGGNQLTSLKGGPTSVGGKFNCSYNSLMNLEGSPTLVGEDFYCNNNKLTSLEGSPTSVGGEFYCQHNQLTNLRGSPTSVGRDFDCSDNNIKSVDGGPSSVGGKFFCEFNKGLGKYQDITDFNVIKVKLLSDREKEMLSTSLEKSSLKDSILKI